MELILKELAGLELKGLYERDFLSLEGAGDQETAGVLAVADALELLRKRNYDLRIFASGLGLLAGERDMDFVGACDLLGLRPVRLENGREELPASAALADVIGVGVDGDLAQSREAAKGYEEGLLDQRPTVLALEAADGLAQLLWLIHQADGVDNLRGALVAFDPGEEAPRPEADAETRKALERLGAVVCSVDELFPNGKEGPQLHSWIIYTQGAKAMAWRRYRPYVIAAMIFLAKAPEPVKLLRELQRRARPRRTI